MRNTARQVAASMPATTTVPRICREAAPAPWAIQSGTQPRMKANEVIRIGRRRSRAPSSAASARLRPFSDSALANSTIRMAFLAARPISTTSPICPKTSKSKCRSSSPRKAPKTATGTESSTLNGSDQLS